MHIKRHIFFVLLGLLLGPNLFCYAQSSILEITEAYFDGNDERVEITNISQTDFVGEVALSGAKSSLLLLAIDLGPSESVIIGDDGEMILSGSKFIGNKGLQLSDTSQISLSLTGPGVYSVFEASSSLVNVLNNKQISLCKSSLEGVVACEAVDRYGVIDGVVANPGRVDLGRFGIDVYPSAGGTTGEISLDEVPIEEDGVNVIEGSGDGSYYVPEENDILSGVSLCVASEDGETKNVYYPSPLLISEIYPFSQHSGSYIEVYARGVYSGIVTFTGAGAGEKSLKTRVSVVTGTYIIFSSEDRGDYVLTGISLRDDGEEIAVFDEYGYAMDRVVYFSGKADKGHYFGSYSGDLRVFSADREMSPGYEIPSTAGDVGYSSLYGGCWIDLQRTSTYEYGSSLNLKAALFDQGGKELSLSEYRCLWEYGDGRYEQLSCNPSRFTYSGQGLYNVIVTIFDGDIRICQTKQTINYISGSIAKASSSSGTGVSIGLVSTTVPKVTSKSTQKILGIGTGLVFSGASDRTHSISGVVVGVTPNPLGKDDGYERIFVQVSGTVLNPNSLGLRIKTTKRYHALQGGTRLSGDMYLFVESFELNNTSGCVELFQKTHSLDRRCYVAGKEGEDVRRYGKKTPVSYMGKPILDTAVRGGSTAPRTSSSGTVSASKNKSSAVKQTSKQTDGKDKKIQQLSKEITSTERLVQLQKNYITLLSKEIAAKSHIFTGNKLQLFDKAYRALVVLAKQQSSVQVQNVSVSVTDIRTYLSLMHNILPIETDLSIPYSQIWQDTLHKYGYMWRVLYEG